MQRPFTPGKVRSASRASSALPAAALLLTGCARTQETTLSTEEDGSVRLGSFLLVSSWPEELTLYDSKDALAAEGLYYASWTAGESAPYTNEDGDTVELYPAQATLLGAERKDPQTAREDIAIWKTASNDNYAVSETWEERIAGQEYELIRYTMKNPDSPWLGGVSAFGVHGNAAVCAELTFQAGFEEDAVKLLTGLLDGFRYSSQENAD